MSDIKAGDLVVVVKTRRCCGFSGSLGKVLIAVIDKVERYGKCSNCGSLEYQFPDSHIKLSNGTVCEKRRLKKIDPPSQGDTLPTRADLYIKGAA